MDNQGWGIHPSSGIPASETASTMEEEIGFTLAWHRRGLISKRHSALFRCREPCPSLPISRSCAFHTRKAPAPAQSVCAPRQEEWDSPETDTFHRRVLGVILGR